MGKRKHDLHPSIQIIETIKDNFPGIFDELEKLRKQKPLMSSYARVTSVVTQYPIRKGYTKDMIISVMTLEAFRKNKTIYSFNDELTEAFMEIDTTIMRAALKTLPFRTFFLEFRKDSCYEGLFVQYYEKSTSKVVLNFLALLPSQQTISVEIELDDDMTVGEIVENVYRKNSVDMDIHTIGLFLIWGLNATLYLCTKNCVIKENEEQKRIYQSHSLIKDKNTEIRKWDIGYREIDERTSKKRIPKSSVNNSGIMKNRPREHMRRAHFHHYWCGPGRTRLELRFVLETSVNKNQKTDELPVVNRKN